MPQAAAQMSGFRFGVRRSPPLWYFLFSACERHGCAGHAGKPEGKIPKRRRPPHSKLKKPPTAQLQSLRVGLVSSFGQQRRDILDHPGGLQIGEIVNLANSALAIDEE